MNKFIYALVIAVIITIGAKSVSDDVSGELENTLVRLHIVADSDEAEAQAVKLKVRDAVLKNVNLADKNFINRAEIIANKVLAEKNMPYKAKAYYGRFYFPSKKYKNITLPAGEYYGVRLVLGNGGGKNWWCIMYPPMCCLNDNEFKASVYSKHILQNNLSSESYELITENNGKIKIKFKTVEIFQKFRQKFVQ